MGSKCLALLSIDSIQKSTDTTLIFFSRCRSTIDHDAVDHSHEISDAASVQSGTSSLLRRYNDENVAKIRFLSVRRLHSRWQKIYGYRSGLLFCAGLAGTVALTNSTITIWACKRFDVVAGFGTIQHGNCNQTKKFSLWLHLAINVLGTALLGASNYTMQCLSSPTRQEIDKAHAKNEWCDIGVPSVRNLRRITWKRIILWWLLAITSFPLHLLYNSAIFDSLSTHEYNLFVVSQEFLTGAPFNIPQIEPHLELIPQLAYFTQRLDSFRNPNSNMKIKKSSGKECISIYRNRFTNSKYQDMLAVSLVSNANNSVLSLDAIEGFEENPAILIWSCADHEDECHTAYQYDDQHLIENCLFQEVDEECMLQFSLPVMLIVIMCNLIKTAAMILVFLGERSRPLMTVGDAIASFLNEPDPTTKNMCLADKYLFAKEGWEATSSTWKLERHRWFKAASIRRWLACNIL